LHNSDIISIERRVTRNLPEDGIKYYNPAQDETGDEFVMVVITPTQEQWLRKFAKRGLCIDDTFNLTGYTLRVAVLVVLNEWDMGLPGAFLISSRMTACEVGILFAEVKKLIPDFDTEFFMSDDTNTFYNGFLCEFPNTQSLKILCAFHIIQSVTRNANRKLKEKSLVSIVKKEVANLCRTRVEAQFKERYEKMLKFLTEKGENGLVDYFKNNWSNRLSQWGGYASIFSPFNTSMAVERFHKRLKHECSVRMGNSRIDSVIHCLIEMPPALEHDFHIRMCRRLSYARLRLADQYKSHDAGIKAFKDREERIEVTEGGWTIHSGANTYHIKERRCSCDAVLNNHCSREGCNACAYAFCCTCPADSKAGVCCLHIHAALIVHPEGRRFTFPFTAETSSAELQSGDRAKSGVNVDDESEEVNEDMVRAETDSNDRNKNNLQQIEMADSVFGSNREEPRSRRNPGACRQQFETALYGCRGDNKTTSRGEVGSPFRTEFCRAS
uniref:SWIM-type domain-containing protein n=1 Tax=Heligmosomoides polygyrus TaxID=6339 RepID=A0A183F923_HELPZ